MIEFSSRIDQPTESWHSVSAKNANNFCIETKSICKEFKEYFINEEWVPKRQYGDIRSNKIHFKY